VLRGETAHLAAGPGCREDDEGVIATVMGLEDRQQPLFPLRSQEGEDRVALAVDLDDGARSVSAVALFTEERAAADPTRSGGAAGDVEADLVDGPNSCHGADPGREKGEAGAREAAASVGEPDPVGLAVQEAAVVGVAKLGEMAGHCLDLMILGLEKATELVERDRPLFGDQAQHRDEVRPVVGAAEGALLLDTEGADLGAGGFAQGDGGQTGGEDGEQLGAGGRPATSASGSGAGELAEMGEDVGGEVAAGAGPAVGSAGVEIGMDGGRGAGWAASRDAGVAALGEVGEGGRCAG
jgi:hypothetical protein